MCERFPFVRRHIRDHYDKRRNAVTIQRIYLVSKGNLCFCVVCKSLKKKKGEREREREREGGRKEGERERDRDRRRRNDCRWQSDGMDHGFR